MEEIKKNVLAIFNEVKAGKLSSGKPIPVGRLTESGKSYLSGISGLDFKELTDFVINPSELNHIYNYHFEINEKDKGNNIPLTDVDIKNMIDVISMPDYILFLGYDSKTQSNKFSFLKSADTNGTYNLLEIHGGSRGNLTVKTFFKTKKGITQRVMELQKSNSLLPTSETYFGASLFLTTIPVMLEPLPLAFSATKNETELRRKGSKRK
jgi:hypothetical protein